MPLTTPCADLPYPENADPIDVAADIEALALATDAALCEPHVLEGDSTLPPSDLDKGQLLYDANIVTVDPKFMWTGTRTEYDALTSTLDYVLYVVVPG